ncbi:hypothetical protein [Acidicapsa ligni]|uniref:hypothetical protein n=1 Tax=Acidicapsa ligni TaxID=542300 RepID=UPI0021E02175|nr:hypothetical protein [Acidicapsa ligni]
MKTAFCLYETTKKDLPLLHLSNVATRGCLALLCAAVLCVVSGCSSSNAYKPTVEGIMFTDVNGTPLKTQPKSLTVGQGSYVNVTLSGDTQLLGANWSVVCGSALPPGEPLPPGQTQDQSCGTFTPAHTMSGPIPTFVGNAVTSGYVALYVAPAAPPKQGAVTLYALATADPNKTASVTLSIDGEPISVSFAPAPPSTMQVGASAQSRVILNNDITSAGVRWSTICGSADCGFFGPAESLGGVTTTYVAPASVPRGGTVQVTATSIADPTKTITTAVSITP